MSKFKIILLSWHIIRLLFLSCLVSIGNSVYIAASIPTTNIDEPTTHMDEQKGHIDDEKVNVTSVFYDLYIPSAESGSRDITTKDNVYNFVFKLLSFLNYTICQCYIFHHGGYICPFFGDWKDRITSIFTFPYYNFFPMYRYGLLSKLPFNSSNNLYLGVTDPLFVGGILGRIIGIFFGRIEIVYDMSTFMPDFLKNRVTFTCISFRALLLFLIHEGVSYYVCDLECIRRRKYVTKHKGYCFFNPDIVLNFILLEVKILEYLYVQIPLWDVVESTLSLGKKILQKKVKVDGKNEKDDGYHSLDLIEQGNDNNY